MAETKSRAAAAAEPPSKAPPPGQIVLVLQGGGALGAYQAGVFEAMHEAGIEPDWVIGTSIGAINASLIAGNTKHNRLARLREFWRRVEHTQPVSLIGGLPLWGATLANMATVNGGIPAFFTPNMGAFASTHWPLGAENAAYYTTEPLRRTLKDLVDFDVINAHDMRLTVGVANVRTSEMRYFDSRDMKFDVRHVVASGALPPAFPAVLIDGEYYWDGGILSNTPVEAVFDDRPRNSGLVFAVHIWNPQGRAPETIWEVMNRQKDVQYSSRSAAHIARQKQIHRLRHIIAELSARLPETARADAAVQEMASYGCTTTMHVVRLLAPTLKNEDHTRDIDFSPTGIRCRWEAGLADTREVIARAPWCIGTDPLEGFVLHEVDRNMEMTTS